MNYLDLTKYDRGKLLIASKDNSHTSINFLLKDDYIDFMSKLINKPTIWYTAKYDKKKIILIPDVINISTSTPVENSEIQIYFSVLLEHGQVKHMDFKEFRGLKIKTILENE